MAMIDYGAILKVDRKIVNENVLLQDMKESVGWSDMYGTDNCINGNYFVYLGDEHFTVAIYKNTFVILKDRKKIDHIWYGFYSQFNDKLPNIENSRYAYFQELDKIVSKKRRKFIYDNIVIDVKAIGAMQYYMHFWYNNKQYDCVYGYGIDSNKKIWDSVKHLYCCNKLCKFIDNFWEI